MCVPAATTSHRTLEDYVARTGRAWRIRAYGTWPDALQAFMGKECAALSTDHALLITASSDRAWVGVVRWTMFALMRAEEKGITADNAAVLRTVGSSEVQRLLQGIPGIADRVGLRPDWAYQAITQVGNYGDIFDRNVGERSAYHLPRGPNRPWTNGGLLYAPAFQ